VGEALPTRPDRLWGPPSLLYNEYRVIPGGKEHGELTSTYVKERVELYFYSSLGLHGLLWGKPYFYVYTHPAWNSIIGKSA